MIKVKPVSIIFIPLFLFILVSCTKEFNEVKLNVESLENIYLNLEDRYYINYHLEGAKIDSLCLYSNGTLLKSQANPIDKIAFIANQIGTFPTNLKVYHHSGLINEINGPQFRVDKLQKLKFDINITTIDSLPNYFIGDELLIELFSKNSDFNMESVQKVTFILNGELIEEKTTFPYIFQTPKILQDSIIVSFQIITQHYREYTHNDTLSFQTDEPPSIKMAYGYTLADYQFSDDSVFINTYTYDNVKIEKVDFFVNGSLVRTEIVNDKRYQENYYYTDLGLGENEIWAVSTDNNGNSAESDHVHFEILNTIIIDEYIREGKRFGNEGLLAILTSEKLYIIDTNVEELIHTFELPHSWAMSMDYDETQNKFYIVFGNGSIYSFNLSTQSFQVLFNYYFKYTSKVIVDASNQRLIIQHLDSISCAYINTNKAFSIADDTYDVRELIYHEDSRSVIFSTMKESFDFFFYKYIIGENSFDYEIDKIADGSTYIKKHPFRNTFINGKHEYNISNLNIYNYNASSYYCYSDDGSIFYQVNTRSYNTITLLNSDTYDKIWEKNYHFDDSSYFPNLYSTPFNDKLALFFRVAHHDVYRVSFLKLDGLLMNLK